MFTKQKRFKKILLMKNVNSLSQFDYNSPNVRHLPSKVPSILHCHHNVLDLQLGHDNEHKVSKFMESLLKSNYSNAVQC